MNEKFFSDARAYRLPYTRKALRTPRPAQAIAKPAKPRRTSSALNPLQAALLERLELAGFAGRFWPMRQPPLRRLYFTAHFGASRHTQIFLSFSDAGTLRDPRLQIRFASEDPADPDQARARQLLQEHYAPALQICQELRDNRPPLDAAQRNQ